MLPDGVDAGLNAVLIKCAVPLLQQHYDLFGKLPIDPFLLVLSPYFQEGLQHLLNIVVLGVQLHLHHILKTKLLVLLDPLSYYLLQPRRSPIRDLVKVCSILEVVTRHLVVRHSHVSLLWVDHKRSLIKIQHIK